MKVIKKENLQNGKYYVATEVNEGWQHMFKQGTAKHIGSIHSAKPDLNLDPISLCEDYTWEYRGADDEEIEWFEFVMDKDVAFPKPKLRFKANGYIRLTTNVNSIEKGTILKIDSVTCLGQVQASAGGKVAAVWTGEFPEWAAECVWLGMDEPGSRKPGQFVSRVKWQVGDELEFIHEVTEYYDNHGNRLSTVEEKGNSYIVGKISTMHPDLIQFKGDESAEIWYMENDFISRKKSIKTPENKDIQPGGYVRVTRDGEYNKIPYYVGDVWKVDSLSSDGRFESAGIFVSRPNPAQTNQFGFSECEYLGMTLDSITQHLFERPTIRAVQDFYSLTKQDQTDGRPKNRSLRGSPPTVRQGERLVEDWIQSRKGKVKLAVDSSINQGAISFVKTKGRGPKGRISP